MKLFLKLKLHNKYKIIKMDSTEFDSQQTIKDMPDSLQYYATKNEKQKFQILQECNEVGEIQDISHFITPRINMPLHSQPCAIKRKRAQMEINEMNGDELIKHDPFFFDDIECDDLDAKHKVAKQLFQPIPKIQRKSLVLIEVK
jgi:hypothetical protein